MNEIMWYNPPFKYYISFGSEVPLKQVIESLMEKEKELTGKMNVNKHGISFELKGD